MASQYIEITGSETRLAGKLRSFIDRLRDVKEDSAHLKAILDQAAFGADYTALGLALDLSAAEAEAVYNLLGSINAALQADGFIAQLLSRVG